MISFFAKKKFCFNARVYDDQRQGSNLVLEVRGQIRPRRKTTKSHSTNIIHSLRVQAEFLSSSVTWIRRFFKRKLHDYMKLCSPP